MTARAGEPVAATMTFDALSERIAALARLIDEREERSKERLGALAVLVDERGDRGKERIAAIRESITTALSAADRAITKSDLAIEKRFDATNEFRKTLTDQTATFLPRTEYAAQHTALSTNLDDIGDRLLRLESQTQGRSEGVSRVGVIVLGVMTAASTLIAIASLILSRIH